VYTVVYTVEPCTPMTGRVHDNAAAVYGPYIGRVHGRPCTRSSTRSNTRVNGPCTQPCTRPYTGRVHGCVHIPVYTDRLQVYTARTRTYTSVTVVYGPWAWLCTGRIDGRAHGPYTAPTKSTAIGWPDKFKWLCLSVRLVSNIGVLLPNGCMDQDVIRSTDSGLGPPPTPRTRPYVTAVYGPWARP